MRSFIQKMLADESGAVTVDFVVVTAAIVILGLVIGFQIQTGISDASSEYEQSLRDQAQLLQDRSADISF